MGGEAMGMNHFLFSLSPGTSQYHIHYIAKSKNADEFCEKAMSPANGQHRVVRKQTGAK
jgi:hypothetical protein